MERAASPPKRCPTEACHAWNNLKKKNKKKKQKPSQIRSERRRPSSPSAASLVSKNEFFHVSSQLSVTTHTAILFSLSTTTSALSPGSDVRGSAARDVKTHN